MNDTPIMARAPGEWIASEMAARQIGEHQMGRVLGLPTDEVRRVLTGQRPLSKADCYRLSRCFAMCLHGHFLWALECMYRADLRKEKARALGGRPTRTKLSDAGWHT